VLASVCYIQAPGKEFFTEDSSINITGECIGKSLVPKHPIGHQTIYACVGFKVHVTSDNHRPVCGNPGTVRSFSNELK
jgi:hypothetical protein